MKKLADNKKFILSIFIFFWAFNYLYVAQETTHYIRLASSFGAALWYPVIAWFFVRKLNQNDFQPQVSKRYRQASIAVIILALLTMLGNYSAGRERIREDCKKGTSMKSLPSTVCDCYAEKIAFPSFVEILKFRQMSGIGFSPNDPLENLRNSATTVMKECVQENIGALKGK